MSLFPGVAEITAPFTRLTNSAQPAQAPVAEAATLVTGSTIEIPPGGLKVGAEYEVEMNVTKTAAGTATSSIALGFVPYGEAVSAANVDNLIVLTKPAGTAAIDTAVFRAKVKVLAIGIAEAGSVVAELVVLRGLPATGHVGAGAGVVYSADTTVATVTTIDVTGGGTMACVLTTGASDAITINSVKASLTQ